MKAYADDLLAEDYWSGSAELSVSYKDKAMKEFQAKHRIDITHQKDRWRNNYLFDLFYKTKQTMNSHNEKHYKTSAQKWSLVAQSNYKLSETSKRYIFGFASFTDDRFSNFDYRSSYAIGYGKRWFEHDNGYFDAELGFGFSSEKPKLDGVENKSIFRIASTFERKLLNDIVFKQTLGVDVATQSDENTKIKQITSLTTKLMRSLALKLNFIIDYNSLVEGERTNTNTETSVILVYNF